MDELVPQPRVFINNRVDLRPDHFYSSSTVKSQKFPFVMIQHPAAAGPASEYQINESTHHRRTSRKEEPLRASVAEPINPSKVQQTVQQVVKVSVPH